MTNTTRDIFRVLSFLPWDKVHNNATQSVRLEKKEATLSSYLEENNDKLTPAHRASLIHELTQVARELKEESNAMADGIQTNFRLARAIAQGFNLYALNIEEEENQPEGGEHHEG